MIRGYAIVFFNGCKLGACLIFKGMLFQILEPVLFLKLRAISKVGMQSLNVTGTTREIT